MSTTPPRHARHHPVARITHWVSVLALLVMTGSGLRIYNAAPFFAPKGAPPFAWWPLEGASIPAFLTFGGWLGGARHWHFAMMWLLLLNAALYLAHLMRGGRWRTILPGGMTWRGSLEMMRYYLYLRPVHPRQGKHNALQQIAYTAMLICGATLILTGLAIWKPVTLGWLTRLLGGYAMARWWHFLAMLVLLLLVVVHVIMVLTVDPYALRAMTTGKYDEARWSPERRNARPLQNLWPRRIP